MNKLQKMPMKLAEFNRIQREAGLPEKTATKPSNKKAQAANRAAHAAQCQAIKAARSSGKKSK